MIAIKRLVSRYAIDTATGAHLMQPCAAILVAVLALSPLAVAPSVRADAVAPLQSWTEAVLNHEAGSADGPAVWLSQVEPEAFEKLFPQMVLVAARASERERRLETCGTSSSGRPSRLWTTIVDKARSHVGQADQRRIEAFADQLQVSCALSFVVRAATLHTDTAVFFPYAGTTAPTDTLKAPSVNKRSRSMIRSTATAVASDGRYGRTRIVLPLWESVRQLLMGVQPDPTGSLFVREWYAAAGAELRHQGNFAAASAHVQEWKALFPQDERLLFDTAQLQEALASPLVQTEIASAVEARRAAARTAGRLTPNDDPSRRGSRDMTRGATVCSDAACKDGRPFGVGSASEHLAEAERLFQKVPSTSREFEAANLRRGRILDRLGRHDAAVEVLRTEQHRSSADGFNAYYRQLFLGSSLEALGRLSDARQAYSAALGLFPRARSANLAIAALLMASGESDAAVAFVDAASVDEASQGQEASNPEQENLDPFDVYELGRGRDAPRLLDELWSHVKDGTWR